MNGRRSLPERHNPWKGTDQGSGQLTDTRPSTFKTLSMRHRSGRPSATLQTIMKRIPEAYVKVWHQFMPDPRTVRPLLVTAAGVAIFTAGVTLGRLLHTLVSG